MQFGSSPLSKSAAMRSPALPASEHNSHARKVAAWLLVCCAMIFVMFVIGAVTRLTESGLSITEWKPITGAIPPLTEQAWQEEFAKYQQIPEYLYVNRGMTLAEFKMIFWWEYVHRLWGRLIGIIFLIPFAWFLIRGYIRGALAWKLGGVFLLGGLQGALGWFMVASGLVDRIDVSPYRLTAHLGMAVALYGLVFWIALGLLRPTAVWAPHVKRLPAGAWALLALVFVTILSGGFVAGNDAGMTYNTFPLMDGHLVPAGYLDEAPWWRNLFENVAAVQFNHRVLGITTFLSALAFAFAAARAGALGSLASAIAGMALLQAALGISTLLLVVPVPLAAAHQAGAIILLTLVLAATHALRRGAVAVKPIPTGAAAPTARTS